MQQVVKYAQVYLSASNALMDTFFKIKCVKFVHNNATNVQELLQTALIVCLAIISLILAMVYAYPALYIALIAHLLKFV